MTAKKIIIGILLTLTSSGTFFFYEKPDGFLHIYFLNVGQGDAIFIKTPEGYNFLIDGGPEKRVLSELPDVLPFFNNTLDYVILTHPDRDHIEGLIYVLEKYKVKHIIYTGAYKKSYFSDRFLQIIQKKNIPVIIADDDHDIVTPDSVTFDILFPFAPAFDVKKDINNTSIVVKVTYGENEILLTGDSEAPEEEKLMAQGADLHADVLKVAHHGSKTSTTEPFLQAVSPQWSIISVGKDNSYHHPHPSTLKRLENYGTKIFRTDQDGRIELVMSKERIVCIKTEQQKDCAAGNSHSRPH